MKLGTRRCQEHSTNLVFDVINFAMNSKISVVVVESGLLGWHCRSG